MSFLVSKKAINGVVEAIKSDLPALIENIDGLKLEKVKKGKHKLMSLKNGVFVSSAKWRPDGLVRIYLIEVYYNVTNEKPEKLEDLVNDFGDCLTECFGQNPTLGGEVLDCNVGSGYFFISESSIHTAIGKLELEVTI